MAIQFANGLWPRHDMAFRHIHLAGAHFQHFEKKGAGMFHPALTAARAAGRVAERTVRHVMPGTGWFTHSRAGCRLAGFLAGSLG
jgi:hypothetical protein